jgi:CheY-like chemotaxis protein
MDSVQPDEAPSGGGAVRHVMIVDDNADAADSLAMLLETVGYDARAWTEPQQALVDAPGFAPDVCILDIGMPVLDGYALVGRLRSALAPAPVRMLAISGYGQERDRARSREAGFDAHLTKPVALEALLEAIERG